MIRPRILFIFDHPLALRSYTETGLIRELKLSFDVRIIFLGNNTDFSNDVVTIHINHFESFMLSLYANIYWYKVADKSLSIQNRTWYSNKSIKKIFSAPNIAYVYNKVLKVSPIKLFAFALFGLFRQLRAIIQDLNVSKIIYVTTGGTHTVSDFLQFFYHEKFDVLTILENWDNMSSKAVLDSPPKKIGVWGEQSVVFASKIHNLDHKRIKPIGNPRVNWLIDNVKNNKLKNSIFFGGGSVNLNSEIEFLLATTKFADKFGLKINYLPHPKNYSNMKRIIKEYHLEEVNFLIDFNSNNLVSHISLPKLSDYVEPFESAKIFVSPLSTMNLEAALLNIPSVALDLSTGLDIDRNRISDRHDHINEAKKLKVFHFISNITDYEELLCNLLGRHEKLKPTRNSNASLQYLVTTKKTFFDNLIEFMEF